jgi:hypothetical protein
MASEMECTIHIFVTTAIAWAPRVALLRKLVVALPAGGGIGEVKARIPTIIMSHLAA